MSAIIALSLASMYVRAKYCIIMVVKLSEKVLLGQTRLPHRICE